MVDRSRCAVEELTADQLALLRIIHELTEAGEPPSYQELALEMGGTQSERMPTARLQLLLLQLQERGWIDAPVGRWRAIRVLHPPPMPDFAEENYLITPAGHEALAGWASDPQVPEGRTHG